MIHCVTSRKYPSAIPPESTYFRHSRRCVSIMQRLQPIQKTATDSFTVREKRKTANATGGVRFGEDNRKAAAEE